MPYAISVADLSKKFRRYHPDRPFTLQEAVIRGWRRWQPADQFWALRDVSFQIKPGSVVGLIGANGAGKSTLLRLIGGVGRPDSGCLKVHGRIGALLDLGAGFHPDLTGRENVYTSGVIAGLTRREVADRFDSIVAFAELEEFIDSPVRTYSTGMRMRLAFAVAVHIEPDILLIDEVLAVGDLAFQQKCLARINQFKAAGCTILFVSHDAAAIRNLCSEVIWLRDGQLVAHGPSEVLLDQYISEMMAEPGQRLPAAISASDRGERPHESRFGSREIEFTAVHLLDAASQPVSTLKAGAALSIKLEYKAQKPIESPIFGITIRREDDFVCYDTNTTAADLNLGIVEGNNQVEIHLARLDLVGGQYYVDVGVYERGWRCVYDYHWRRYPLTIQADHPENGILYPPVQWKIGVEAKPVKFITNPYLNVR